MVDSWGGVSLCASVAGAAPAGGNDDLMPENEHFPRCDAATAGLQWPL